MKIKNFLNKLLLILPLTLLIEIATAQSITDHQLKKNIADIENAAELIEELDPKTFEYESEKYKGLGLPQKKQYGFISENIERHLPDLVRKRSYSIPAGKNAYRNATVKEVDLAGLVPLLVAALKEQQKEINDLKNQVQQLKSQTKLD